MLTLHSKKCWVVLTMPLGVTSYVMLWYTPQDTMSSAFSFSWYFIWCCLFDTFMSVSPLLLLLSAHSFQLFYTFSVKTISSVKDISCLGGWPNLNLFLNWDNNAFFRICFTLQTKIQCHYCPQLFPLKYLWWLNIVLITVVYKQLCLLI